MTEASDKERAEERVEGKHEEGGERVDEIDDSETEYEDWDVETETEDWTKGVQDPAIEGEDQW